jgi:DNA-binding ferritin-like protein (Dps family)
MEILVYKNNIEKDYRTIAVIEWKNFEQKIKVRPEDYVFYYHPMNLTNLWN